MSLHKLTAGGGYDYLTRQVAAMDSTEKGHTSLASYYTEKGETPGVWTGAGMAGIDGLAAGDVVTAEQMHALFGLGMHPLAAAIYGDRDTADVPLEVVERVARLGAPYRLPDRQVSDFRIEVARRVAACSVAAGGTTRSPLPAAERAAIRTTVAREFFRAEHGRDPADERELAGAVARYSRPPATAVAGFDLTFSPVKSVSALWAVADPAVAARIEVAHNAAVAEALRFLEAEALFTRLGAGGVRQVEVRGLVAAAFTHRDSRAGDPDLHTHVAVANKVQTRDGAWRAIDGRVLYKAAVTASEVYNTALEKQLTSSLGVRFVPREQPRPDLRPVREIDGVPAALLARWSARRAAIETRRGALAADFQAAHGRPPSPVEALQLAQQATLETRDAKHEPRSLSEQRAAWAAEAAQVLGGPAATAAMVARVLSPDPAGAGVVVDAAWVDAAAGRVVVAMEARRAVWQIWHVKAEALRQARAADLPPQQVAAVVDLVTDEVLTRRCLPLTRPETLPATPAALTRTNGASVYTVAGSQLYSSPAILTAEQALLGHAGRVGGTRIPAGQVDLALLELAANGLTLNDGQAAMVAAMATSGARLQLVIAPAGSGKTTAMSALTQAWTAAGGTVLGLAPSAAAAAALREQTGTTTDTMAKLTWALRHGQELPDWAQQIGPRSLVIIDEAGMADTLSLATVADFVIGRGGNVRLIGDTQQLAAVGAGGILRDIDATHGALRLTEIVRFTDPAEAAASLALRDGAPEALGFYLDPGRSRIHVGDPTTTLDGVFTAWAADIDAGRDAVMLAATRDQVSHLNARAQTHTRHTDGPRVALADGNHARPGDVIITRRNDRALRTSATDFVKNGDRWDVLHTHADGRLDVAHRTTRRRLTLPASYVRSWVDLGYASTINTAQGITADTAHALLAGTETRRQAYTALTRGRHGNHVHLQIVGDGEEHTVIHPETTAPDTPAETLARILGRDDTPTSVTTQLRDQDDPRAHLADAADRYLDALHVAADHLTPHTLTTALDERADQIVPGVTDAPAWPTLRAHLLLIHAAGGHEPLLTLATAATAGDLTGARDPAAVLHWRIDTRPLHTHQGGPLPWLPAVPDTLAGHPEWGPYLTARAARVRDLAATLTPPDQAQVWVRHRAITPPGDLIAAIDLWRVATRVPDTDHRPTGPRQMFGPSARHQTRLDARLAALDTPALDEWLPLLTAHAPTIGRDPFILDLTERLAATSRAGLDTPALLHTAVTGHGPLPDDHAAAALWWRLHTHLPTTVLATTNTPTPTTDGTPGWMPELTDLLGAAHVHTLQQHPDWQALAAALTRATARGWTLPHLLGPATDTPEHLNVDELLWRAAITLDPPPDDTETPAHPDQLPPDDLDQLNPYADSVDLLEHAHPDDPPPPPADDEPDPGEHDAPEDHAKGEDFDPAAAWSTAVLRRHLRGPLQLTERELERQLARAWEIDSSPIPEHRLLQLNAAALEFYRGCYPGSWAQAHLIDRFGDDLTSHAGIRPGYAPDTWTALVTHLTRRGATDEELLTAGLATRASTGRLIDRFRDRVLFPITREEKILGFVGRRHPDATDTDRRGPKYLNTGDTLLYRKGDQLYTAGTTAALNAGLAAPVLVEGPMDAIAVTLAGQGRYLGVAALGTSLTTDQARQLATWPATPIIATDNDPAGQLAGERDFWLLTPHNLDPLTVTLPPGHDPASIYTSLGPGPLARVIEHAAPLGDHLLHTMQSDDDDLRLEAISNVIAARPAETWSQALLSAGTHFQVDPDVLAHHVINTANSGRADEISTHTPGRTDCPRHTLEQRNPQMKSLPAETERPPGPYPLR